MSLGFFGFCFLAIGLVFGKGNAWVLWRFWLNLSINNGWMDGWIGGLTRGSTDPSSSFFLSSTILDHE
jgi:hypothetical protein